MQRNCPWPSNFRKVDDGDWGERIDGLSGPDAADHLVNVLFKRLKGITGAGGLANFCFEDLGERIDLLTKRFGDVLLVGKLGLSSDI